MHSLKIHRSIPKVYTGSANIHYTMFSTVLPSANINVKQGLSSTEFSPLLEFQNLSV
jgi:hypothetical protein